jgi:C-terminal processing protease CtpA/Prc
LYFFNLFIFFYTGALRDNHRALIIGDKPTFGKGRIQSVYELQDGSALFVTVAK